MRKHLVTGIATLAFAALLLPSAAMAQDGGDPINGGFGVGAGWGTVDDGDSAIMALVQYRGAAWEVEFDYLFGDDSAWALHGDYIYAFDREYDSMDSGIYVGAGWSFVDAGGGDGGTTGQQTTPSEDNESSDNGLNVLVGYDISSQWGIEGRWSLLDNDLITVSATWNFGAMDGGSDQG